MKYFAFLAAATLSAANLDLRGAEIVVLAAGQIGSAVRESRALDVHDLAAGESSFGAVDGGDRRLRDRRARRLSPSSA